MDTAIKVNWDGRRKTCGAFLFKELRQLSLILLCLTVYCLLYISFGGLHRPATFETRQPQIFPRKIWQSWKVHPLDFEDRDSQRARTWVAKNPSHRYEVLTDGNGYAYVEQVFGPTGFDRPDILHVYKSLNDKIIQADLIRYIIMYAEGGIWADIDVEAVRSFSHFVPKRFHEQDLDMIIGVETDEPDYKDHPVLGSKAQSFCQWTFVCKPRLPVMLKLIENILIRLDELSQEQEKPISQITLNFDEILSVTGPSAFTDAILATMTEHTGHRVTWEHFHDMEESKAVGRVLVLPSEAFAAGTGHSNSGNHGGKGALVKHHFHASSWTKSHPRFKHPIYGEVEKCNWDEECVRLWDANTAFFSSLSPQEQSKMIAIKELDENELLKAESLSSPPPIFVDMSPPSSDEGSVIETREAAPEEHQAITPGLVPGIVEGLSLDQSDYEAGNSEEQHSDSQDDGASGALELL